jgi:hypothetical protein
VILHQELERMATAFVDVPGLLPQKIQVRGLRAFLLCLGCRIAGFEGVSRGSTGNQIRVTLARVRLWAERQPNVPSGFAVGDICAETRSWTPSEERVKVCRKSAKLMRRKVDKPCEVADQRSERRKRG